MTYDDDSWMSWPFVMALPTTTSSRLEAYFFQDRTEWKGFRVEWFNTERLYYFWPWPKIFVFFLCHVPIFPHSPPWKLVTFFFTQESPPPPPPHDSGLDPPLTSMIKLVEHIQACTCRFVYFQHLTIRLSDGSLKFKYVLAVVWLIRRFAGP